MTLKIIERHTIGSTPLVDITEHQLEGFIGDINKYSNTVISKVYSMVKYAYNIAYRAHLIDYNPMESLSFKKPKSQKRRKKVRGFTEEEQKRFVQALEDHKVPYGRNTYKKQLLIEIYGGLRMGEINALKPEDIDFDKKLIHINATVTKGMDERVFIKEGAKTAEGERYVPINSKLAAVLRETLDEMRTNSLGLVFYDYNKYGIIHTNQVNCFFHRICEKADLKGVSQHS